MRSSPTAWAATYGEDAYGDGSHNVKEKTTSDSTLPSPGIPDCDKPTPSANAPNLYAAVPDDSTAMTLYFGAVEAPMNTLHLGIRDATRILSFWGQRYWWKRYPHLPNSGTFAQYNLLLLPSGGQCGNV